MIFKQLFDQKSSTYTYLLADPVYRQAVIIDPVLEKTDRDLKLIADLGLQLIYTLDTHIHADHITGSGQLRKETGALSVASAAAGVDCVDRAVQDGDLIRFGTYHLEVRSTPGHTAGCVSYVLNANGKVLAFTGDALFIRGCGRTDFQQGDANTLYHSVHNQIYSLPENTLIYPGHDYHGHTSTTVSEEKAHNPRLKLEISASEFVQIMDGLNLADPKLMDVAVPANMACGGADVPTETAKIEIRELEPTRITELERYRVVDVRQPEEFTGKLGHIDGAELTPLSTLAKFAKDWRRDDALLLVCGSGIRSTTACNQLAQMGFTNLSNLTGGMNAWNACATQKDLR